ncbi:S-layer homology domain-containing protein [Candidatus Pacearchaeota archaeon]|nr:S-layer homology domain-containing protein [Candidatus Pacearchaeota archaeon]
MKKSGKIDWAVIFTLLALVIVFLLIIYGSPISKFFGITGEVVKTPQSSSDEPLAKVILGSTKTVVDDSVYSSTESTTHHHSDNETDNDKPNSPSGLQVTSITKTSITLQWNDNSNNEDGFKIYRSLSPSGFTKIYAASKNIHSYTDSGLTSGTTYYYKVLAYNDAGNSGFSNIVSATTLTNNETNITENIAPIATNLILSPSNPKTTDNLVASYSYSDADNDTESGTEIRWYKNGILQTVYNNDLTISASVTTKNDVWYFTVQPKDGTTFGQLKTSNSVTILNSAPVFGVHNTEIEENQLLELTLQATDADNDRITFFATNLPEGAELEGNLFRWDTEFGDAGQYVIKFRATDSETSVEKSIIITVNPVQTFVDVPRDYWAWEQIEILYANGVTIGCEDNASGLYYCPDRGTTRLEMAGFLGRALDLDYSQYTSCQNSWSVNFIDVPYDTIFWGYTQALYEQGITNGCRIVDDSTTPSTREYCPNDAATRAEVATFLQRALGLPVYNGDQIFDDVSTDYWAYGSIGAIAEEGITLGCDSQNFCPDRKATRAETGVMLVRAFNLE